jgi:hypothetical protein
MTVDLDYRGVDHPVFHIWIIRAGIKYPFKNISFAPITEAAKRCAPVAEKWSLLFGMRF